MLVRSIRYFTGSHKRVETITQFNLIKSDIEKLNA